MVTEVIGGVLSLIHCLRLLGSKRFDHALLIDLAERNRVLEAGDKRNGEETIGSNPWWD